MRRQDFVRVKPRPVRLLIDKLPVGRCAGPVHELVGQVGAFVKIVHAQGLGQVSCHRHILLRRYIPRQRDQYPHPRRLRRVAVGAVEDGGVGNPAFIVLQEFRLDPVPVQRYHGPGDHRVDLAPPVL